jgi:hypothetical protein
MSDQRRPPAHPCGDIELTGLDAGTRLWRVHPTRVPASEFRAVPSDDLFGGGRFDSTSKDLYPYLYTAFAPETALCETLLTGLGFGPRKVRQLPRAQVNGRSISAVEITVPLKLISLVKTTNLVSLCQSDDWLLRADGHEYAQTREWAHWLRAQEPAAQGLVWQSRHNLMERSVVLFGDRCPPDSVVANEETIELGDCPGADYLNRTLQEYRVVIARPRRRP